MNTDSIPYGYCQCGCGQKTSLASRNRRDRQWIKGQPTRFIPTHSRPWRTITTADFTPEDRGYTTLCWIWAHRVADNGYGVVNRSYGKDDPSRPRSAHAVAYVQFIGPIPDGLVLDHLCRVRACVNPIHLEPVTMAVNLQRGAMSKLNFAKADEIRRLRRAGYPYRDLAERYAVSESTIGDVIHNRRWVQVDPPR